MNPSFQVQLQKWCRKNNVSTPKKVTRRQKPQKCKSKHLSESEINSLMGRNMPIFKRHRGALKQR